MKIKKIITILEQWAPLSYAEEFDNVGLLVGNKNLDCTGLLITIDTTEAIIEEAIEKKCNLIVSFHPIIFSGLKKLTGKNYVEKIVVKAIENKIAVYSIHTALDNHKFGVSYKIGEKLGLLNQKILIPKNNTLKKLSVLTPENKCEEILNALYLIGAEEIGDYENCIFTISGTGTFMGNNKSNSSFSLRHKKIIAPEKQINMIFNNNIKNKIIKVLEELHPYDKIRYEIYSIDDINQDIGMGSIGELKNPLDSIKFMELVKYKMKTKLIKHSELLHKKVVKVAVLGGSGSFAIENAILENADVYITSDLKYHDFFKTENKIILMDIGHYESEQFTKNLIYEYLTKKLTNFACILSQVQTNPIKYF